MPRPESPQEIAVKKAIEQFDRAAVKSEAALLRERNEEGIRAVLGFLIKQRIIRVRPVEDWLTDVEGV